MAHADIRIVFSIAGRWYEAVGFLQEGEKEVDGPEMLARTDEDDRVIGKEDYDFIWAHRDQLPHQVQRYYLVSKARAGHPDSLRVFWRRSRKWKPGSKTYSHMWHSGAAVIRRTAAPTKEEP